ncbi:glycosyltransferase [Vampirovibrio sp.]|uniref:glycosyltransferase n=1 Tax=Vampirovibrio sp. TaxID=2717857 RepID=UPI0035936143
MPVSLSLAMIVKNEAQVLGRILSQVKHLCDELVIVDTGSTDGTQALAESFGARVFCFEWIDDFAAARNHAFSHCSSDWILWLDADDLINESHQQKLLDLKHSGLNAEIDAVICSYQIAFDGQGECLISMPRERLLRRAAGGSWQFPIHEAFVLPDEARVLNRLDIAVEHHKPAQYVERSSDRNLKMLMRLIEQGDQSPRNWYYYGKELRQHNRPEEAIEAFQQHLRLNQTEPISQYQALHLAMLCCMELHRYPEALSLGYQAIQINGSRAEALLNLGIIHYRHQDFNIAIPLLNAATTCQKPDAGLIVEEDYSWKPYHYLSLCYEGLGQPANAIEAALKAYPDIPDKQVIRENIICFAGKLK